MWTYKVVSLKLGNLVTANFIFGKTRKKYTGEIIMFYSGEPKLQTKYQL